MEWEALYELIRTRRSIRAFQQKPVPEDLLLRILEAATWAPNGGNHQAWRFWIVSNRDLIDRMGDAVKAKTELLASWPEALPFSREVSSWRKTSDFFRRAPVCIAVLMGKYASIADRILMARGDGDPEAEEIRTGREIGKSSLQSCAAAMAYLCLLLHQAGLGTTWMAGPLQAKKDLERILGVPPEWDFVGLFPVGYPAEQPEPRPRKPVHEVIRFIR